MSAACGESSMSDGATRFRLPLLLLSFALLVGGSKLDSLRPVEGQVVALALPVIAVWSGAGPFLDTIPPLRNAAFGIGAVVLVFSELGAYGAVIGPANGLLPLTQRLLLMACVIGALLCEVAAAQRSLRVRLTAWIGLAVVFGLYLPGHVSDKNLFGSVFAAFILALFAGGGVGLLLGELAVRRARG